MGSPVEEDVSVTKIGTPADTGINHDWSFQWSSSDTSVTLTMLTEKNTDVTFSIAGDYTVKMTATSPGSERSTCD